MSQPEQEDNPPWERTGAVRRDCEPHRGHLLLLLGFTGLVCGFLSLLLIVPGIVSLVLAVIVRVMAQSDLGKMRAGLMDPRGRLDTEKAQAYAVGGMLFSLAAWGVCCFFGWMLLTLHKPPHP